MIHTALCGDRVIIQKENIVSRCCRLVPDITSHRKARVLGVLDQLHARILPQILQNTVRGGIIHDDDLVSGNTKLPVQRMDTMSHPYTVVVGYDDRGERMNAAVH